MQSVCCHVSGADNAENNLATHFTLNFQLLLSRVWVSGTAMECKCDGDKAEDAVAGEQDIEKVTACERCGTCISSLEMWKPEPP